MRLYIHGVGALTMGEDEPFVDGMGALAEIPIADYAKSNQRRRFGRLAKLFYVAATRAVEDAGVDDIDELAVVGATAVGETSVSLDIITQIRASRGKTLSPRLVPNSVHNSPAGYFSIGKKNHRPSVTVSQGWLSGEAGLMAAEDILTLGLADKVLVMLGDETDLSWITRLEGAGATEWASSLRDQFYQEGAVALVLGRAPGGKGLGSVVGGVVRAKPDAENLTACLDGHRLEPGPGLQVRVRAGAGGQALMAAVRQTPKLGDRPIHFDDRGPGSAQAGAFLTLKQQIEQSDCTELLLLGAELDELAFIHWVR
jgi:hypothetical protein